MTDRLNVAISGAFYLIALAVQIGGFSNVIVAYVLGSIATILLLIPAKNYLSEGRMWAQEIKSEWLPRRLDRQKLLDNEKRRPAARTEVVFFILVVLLAIISAFVFSSPDVKNQPNESKKLVENPTYPIGLLYPLSDEVSAALYLRLTKVRAPLYGVEIACGNEGCKKLANSFFVVFKELGWSVSVSNTGVLAAGTRGLLMHPETERSRDIAVAIQESTGIKVRLSDTKASEVGRIYLVVGRPDLGD